MEDVPDAGPAYNYVYIMQLQPKNATEIFESLNVLFPFYLDLKYIICGGLYIYNTIYTESFFCIFIYNSN